MRSLHAMLFEVYQDSVKIKGEEIMIIKIIKYFVFKMIRKSFISFIVILLTEPGSWYWYVPFKYSGNVFKV